MILSTAMSQVDSHSKQLMPFAGMTLKVYVERAQASMAKHCQAMVEMQDAGAHVFDYGNNLRGQAELAATMKPSNLRALSRNTSALSFVKEWDHFVGLHSLVIPEDIKKTDECVKKLIDKPELHRWLEMADAQVQFQGLPLASAGWATESARRSAWHSMS